MANEPEKHVHKPVTEGKVVEKSKFEKAVSLFFAEDVNTVTDSIMDDFIKPRLKQFGKEANLKFRQFVAESVKGCVDILIFGNTKKGSSSSSYYGSGTYKNYSVHYSDEYGNSYSNGYSYDTDAYGFKFITVPSYGACEEVKSELIDILKHYNKASVADYYELCGAPVSKTDYNYGWKNSLSDVNIITYKDGYLLDLPRPRPL